MIEAIAIDDQQPALKLLENFCAQTNVVNPQKTFNKPAEALKRLRNFPVDLLFPDINMPSVSRLESYKERYI